MKIVILDGGSLNNTIRGWDGFRKMGEVTVYDRTDQNEIIEKAGDAEVILTNKTILSAKTILALPKLRYIGILATGYNKIVDLDAARSRGLVVTNVPAYSTMSVAQMVFAHLLNITQQVAHYAHEVRKGMWSSQKDFCYWNTPLIELAGKRMGIIGFGNTGQATAKMAEAFGMEVYVFTSKPQACLPETVHKLTLDELFAECDVVSLHCPLLPETRHIVNAYRLSLMRNDAILINTGRGELIDEEALVRALTDHKLLGAGLDVLTAEPPESDNPLFGLPNCYITPHIAWATQDSLSRLVEQAEKNLQAWLMDETINNILKTR